MASSRAAPPSTGGSWRSTSGEPGRRSRRRDVPRESPEEGREVRLLARRELERPELAVAEVRRDAGLAAPVVEVDHVLERRDAPVVEVGPGHGHVAEGRRLERAVLALPPRDGEA